MPQFKRILLGLLLCSVPSPAKANTELPTVPKVDLSRYLGTWYEVARFPNSFQKNCDQAIANYSLKENGDIEVLNTCLRKKDQSQDEVRGVARVEDKTTGAKLSVTFLPGWLRWTGIGVGKYWIIDLGADYEYAVVSEPNRKYLWILSRTVKMSAELKEKILERLQKQGFDTSKLISSREQE